MNKQQLYKILKITTLTTLMMLVFEIVFSLPLVTDFFESLIFNAQGWIVYLIIWAIMFGQVTILNIPAYVILSASVSIGLAILSPMYIAVTISAYMFGAMLAYGIGRKFGVKALKWCAGSEEDYNKWSTIINNKGKWFYFLTILFPIFPDDLLCIVAGSTKFNFGLYVVFNFIGRTIGLITMCLVLDKVNTLSTDFPFMIIFWAVLLLAQIITMLIIKRRLRNE